MSLWPRRRESIFPDPVTDVHRARLAAWVDHLDVDLEAAQAVLRLPITQLPPAPGEPVPLAVKGLRGAYARRAAKPPT